MGLVATDYVELCFETPQDQTYFYRLPEGFSAAAVPGLRVVAPLGPRRETGFLLRVVGEDEVRRELEAKLARRGGGRKAPAAESAGLPGMEDAGPSSGGGRGCREDDDVLAAVREVIKPADEAAYLTPRMVELGRWIAAHYGASLGEALGAMLPAAVKQHKRSEKIRFVELLEKPEEARRLAASIAARAPQQAVILETLAECPGRLTVGELLLVADVGEGAVRALARKMHLRVVEEYPQERVFMGYGAEAAKEFELTAEQRAAVEAVVASMGLADAEGFPVSVGGGTIQSRRPQADGAESASPSPPVAESEPGCEGDDTGGKNRLRASSPRVPPPTETGKPGPQPGAVHLIRGVTGSGKTEVYIRAAQAARERGRQSIVLLPEIALTPQTCARFRSRFASLAGLHSHLTAGQRAEEWRRIRDGHADVVIGARSAVFAPVPRLGLVVVDEEHETSYKQDTAPRYHAREVAARRAELEGAVCVLGSATPSLESLHAARTGRYRLHVMEKRATGYRLPPVELIDTRAEGRENRFFMALSRRLKLLLGACLKSGGSAIVFLNRRGWATAIICARCGYVARCEHCQVAMVFHRHRNAALCHYCGAEKPFEPSCPDCRGPLRQIGLGTERVADEVAKAFPEARVARLDSDVMADRTAHAGILADFREGKTNVLVGTQMVGKGLDFPRVTLVGMVNADTALNLPDFRSAERTFQLVSQVAGRAGRGEMGGRVAVQTAFPEHSAVAAAAKHDYLEFAEKELISRSEFFWPPYARLLRVVTSAKEAIRARERAEEIATVAHAACGEPGAPAAPSGRAPQVLGPAPCPLEKIEDLYRWHVMVKCRPGADSERLLAVLKAACTGARRGVRAVLDADPAAML